MNLTLARAQYESIALRDPLSHFLYPQPVASASSIGPNVHFSFRSGFKYVFRWLPCITWHPNDALGIGGGCTKIVRMGVNSEAGHAIGGRDGLGTSATTTAYRGVPRNGGAGGGANVNNGGGKSVSRCLLSTTQQTLLSDSNDQIDADGCTSGLLGAGGGGGRIGMQLRPVGGSVAKHLSPGSGVVGTTPGGFCSPLKVCEDNF